jgi:hypothetical protein
MSDNLPNEQTIEQTELVTKKTTVIEDIGDIWADVLDCIDRNDHSNLVKSDTINKSGDIFDEVLHYHEPIRKDEKVQINTNLNTNKMPSKKFKKSKKS